MKPGELKLTLHTNGSIDIINTEQLNLTVGQPTLFREVETCKWTRWEYQTHETGCAKGLYTSLKPGGISFCPWCGNRVMVVAK